MHVPAKYRETNRCTAQTVVSHHILITLIDKTNEPKPLGGGNLDWINDGFCDDINNNEACEFDDRDCCGVHVDKRYCLECKCLSKSKIIQKDL